MERIREPSRADEVVPPLEPVLAVDISPEGASRQLILLNTKFPLPAHLGHVKRIWRRPPPPESSDTATPSLRLLLSPVPGEWLPEDWEEFLARTPEMRPLGPVFEERVPSRMPQSRGEFDAWRRSQHWPTCFHEPRTVLREEIEEAALVESLSLQVIPQLLRPLPPSVIIVDPKHPDAAHWTLVHDEAVGGSKDASGGASLLAEPVMQAIDAMAQKHVALETTDDPDRPYLCTGLVAFCHREPSIMAAMALVHSRIRAVVFIHPDEQRGGLLSRLRLQFVRETNHHFSVYQCHLPPSE